MLEARPQACRGEPAAAMHEILCPWVLVKSLFRKCSFASLWDLTQILMGRCHRPV